MAEYLVLDADLIIKKGRGRSIALARSIICALGVDRLMCSGGDLARKLDMSPSSVSKLVARGRAILCCRLSDLTLNTVGGMMGSLGARLRDRRSQAKS